MIWNVTGVLASIHETMSGPVSSRTRARFASISPSDSDIR